MRWWALAGLMAGAVALGVAALFFLPGVDETVPIGTAASDRVNPPAYQAEDCPEDLRKALERDPGRNAECGKMTVSESPGARRKLRLYVVRLKAAEPDSAVPLLLIAGGPGNSISSHLDKRLPYLLPLAPHRDILIVDLRGTGASEPRLDCKEPLRGKDAVASCFQNWSTDLDPAAFSTERAMEDLREILVERGVQRVVLYGVSYGTTVALAFARRYREMVEGLVLDSPVPGDKDVLAPIAKNAADAIGRLLNACAAQVSCAEAFPHKMEDFVQLVGRLEGRAVGQFDGAEFTHSFSNLMFSPTALRFLPFILAEAHAGRFSHLQRLVEAFGEPSFAMGTHLSVQCAEAFPRTTLASIQESDAQVPTPLGSIFTSERYISYCDAWRMTPVGPTTFEGTTNVPTLVLSGYFDHLTPPASARSVAATLPNAQIFIDPTMGHGVAFSECGAAMVASFIQTLPQVSRLSSAHCQEHTEGLKFSLASPSGAELEKVKNELRYRL